MRALQDDHRTAAFRAVVCKDGPDARHGAQADAGRGYAPILPGDPAQEGLHDLAREPQGLDDLSPIMVGPPDSRVVRLEWESLRRAYEGRSLRTSRHAGAYTGRGRPRHMVLVRALAVFDAWMDGGRRRGEGETGRRGDRQRPKPKSERSRCFLSDRRSRYGP